MASQQILALAQRIKDEFGIVVDPESFRRTYAGWNQRAAGAITWEIRFGPHNIGSIGGFEPVRKYITKRNQLAIHETPSWHMDKELFAIAPGEPGYKTRKGKLHYDKTH